MNFKKELSTCNTNRWQRESKATSSCLLNPHHSRMLPCDHVRTSQRGKPSPGQEKKRHGKNTEQPEKSVPVRGPKEITAQGIKRIIRYDLRNIQ